MKEAKEEGKQERSDGEAERRRGKVSESWRGKKLQRRKLARGKLTQRRCAGKADTGKRGRVEECKRGYWGKIARM